MRSILFISFFSFLIISCSREVDLKNDQENYTYNIEGWESLGSQTLVMLDAVNATRINQEITFKVEVINSEGRSFSKDTTIKFEANEVEKNFQLLVDTEGEIKDVKVKAIQ